MRRISLGLAFMGLASMAGCDSNPPPLAPVPAANTPVAPAPDAPASESKSAPIARPGPSFRTFEPGK